MTLRHHISLLLLSGVLLAPPGEARERASDTIASLENKTVEVRPGKIILDSSELARQSYRDFLDLVSDDPELRAEAMRRLGDLELEASEAEVVPLRSVLHGNVDMIGQVCAHAFQIFTHRDAKSG